MVGVDEMGDGSADGGSFVVWGLCEREEGTARGEDDDGDEVVVVADVVDFAVESGGVDAG
jgi:hypothetical protein